MWGFFPTKIIMLTALKANSKLQFVRANEILVPPLSIVNNSIMREIWIISYASNKSREAELFIHVYLIKEIIYYDVFAY